MFDETPFDSNTNLRTGNGENKIQVLKFMTDYTDNF